MKSLEQNRRHPHHATRRIRSFAFVLSSALALGACRPSDPSAPLVASAQAPAGTQPQGLSGSADGGATTDGGGTPDSGASAVTAASPPIVWSDAPVILAASRNYATGEDSAPSTTTEAPVTFTIPGDIYVRTGNAGNGKAEFKFLTPSGVVTCTYEGGSSTAHPTTDLDQMHGRRYRLVGCDNGAGAGQSQSAKWFSLQVLGGDAQDPSGMTSVSLHLGGGCSDQLAAPLAADEVVSMRDGFKWDLVGKLPETDVEGHPALFHGLIYVESKEQLAALDRMRVFWSAQPLSERYMSGLRGKCGRVEHATDGKGVVVYAVFPARLFNMIRDVGIQTAKQGITPPFKFIIPSPPDQPEYVNADGSLKYSALASSGFGLWLSSHSAAQPNFLNPLDWPGDVSDAAKDAYHWTEDNVVDPLVGGGETIFDYGAKGWDAFVDFSVNLADDAWEKSQQFFGSIVGLVSDKINVHFGITIANRDDQFPVGSTFTRLWGPSDGSGNRPKVVPSGAEVRVRQWGWGFLPVMSQGQLAETGDVSLTAIKGAHGREGDVCIEMDTDYARMTSDFIPNEICDFATGRYHFDANIDDKLIINQPDLFGLTQIKDSSDYYRTVVGASPHTFQVLTGWVANNLTTAFAKEPRAMTLCLDFPGTGAAALTTALTVAPVVVGGTIAVGFQNKSLGALAAALGPIAASLVEKDLWWPDADTKAPNGKVLPNARDSRGIMTHEYGHFVMCSLLYDQGGPTALTGLMARLREVNVDRSSNVALMTEAWADTFAMQVAGGTNYIQSAKASGDWKLMHFCTESPCMDENYVGASDYSGADGFLDELARFESLFHDAFDRGDSVLRFTNAPGNGDVLAGTDGALTVSPVPYLANQDEQVSLPGRAWKTWAKHWLERGRTPSPANVVGGLVQTMADQGFNWCDRCELLALHTKETEASARAADPSSPAPTVGQQQARWRACAASPELKSWLGPAPAPYLNMAPSCTPCPLHNFVDGNGVCHPCGDKEVSRAGKCVPCGQLNGISSTSEECIIG